MRFAADGGRLIDGEKADVALLEKHGIEDVPVGRVDVRHRRRLALNVRHH
jgi:hypothetical protein